MMESDIVNEIMESNKPKRGQKARTGFIISYRLLLMGAVIYLSILATNWNNERLLKSQTEREQNEKTEEMRLKIINELHTLTIYVRSADAKIDGISRQVEDVQKTKADKNDLNRLEDRFNRQFERGFINIPDSNNLFSDNVLSCRRTLKNKPHE